MRERLKLLWVIPPPPRMKTLVPQGNPTEKAGDQNTSLLNTLLLLRREIW